MEREAFSRASAVNARLKPRAPSCLFPDLTQIHDHLDGLFHVLNRHPLETRMEVVFAGEQVRGRQAHEAEARSIRAAANGPGPWFEARASDRFPRVLDDQRVM